MKGGCDITVNEVSGATPALYGFLPHRNWPVKNNRMPLLFTQTQAPI